MNQRPPAAISFVVPLHNGAGTIRQTLDAIGRQIDGRHVEIIVVDDRSQDDSRAIVEALAADLPIRLVDGPGRGAAAAINAGVLSSTAPVICQVDQDVVIGPGWVDSLRAMLASPDVAAAQGYYTAPRDGSAVVRAMGLDLEQRYAAIDGDFSDHVCTGNTAYNAAALHQVGLFDERLGYGYDNDMSYRLRAAGYRLAHLPRGTQRASLARGARRLPASAVRLRLRPAGRGREASAADQRRFGFRCRG